MRQETRIYVASLSDYNEGRLVGAWIDADQDAEDIAEEIQEMLKKSNDPNAEEWAIHDSDMCGVKLNENMDLELVSSLAKAIAEHGEAFACFVNDVVGVDWVEDDIVEQFEETYNGCFDTERAFAEYCVDEGFFGNVPSNLENYIDYDAIARDLFCCDYCSVSGSEGLHVFRNC